MANENGKSGTETDNSNVSAILAWAQNSWDLIEFAKNQQWRVSYYALLLFAAIVGIRKTGIFGQECWQKGFLFVVAALSAVFALGTIIHSHSAQRKARDRVKECAQRIGSDFEEIWRKYNTDDKSWHYLWYAIFLAILTFAGLAIVFWVLYFGSLDTQHQGPVKVIFDGPWLVDM